MSQKINITKMDYNINYVESCIKLVDDIFDSNNIATYYEKVKFETFCIKKALYFIDKEADKNLYAYKVGENTYILFNKKNKISGVLWKDLNEEELNICKSKFLI